MVLSHEVRRRHSECRGELPERVWVGPAPTAFEQTHGVGGDASQLGQLLLAECHAPTHRSERGEWYAPGLTLFWAYLPPLVLHAVLLALGVPNNQVRNGVIAAPINVRKGFIIGGPAWSDSSGKVEVSQAGWISVPPGAAFGSALHVGGQARKPLI